MHFTHKNIVLIALSALFIGGVFIVAEYRNSQAKKVVYTSPISAVVNELPSELQALDSDSDGLKDWEEILLGTDPRKPDSDGDGTNDGKEATSGRNPLVKGPNDSEKDTVKSEVRVAELTPTEKLSRDFFARYMELNKAGLAGDKASQAELVGQVLQNGLVAFNPKQYAIDKIIIHQDNSSEALRRYGNSVGAVFSKYKNTGRDEGLIMSESLEKEDYEILKEIDPIIAIYENTVSSLLSIAVPSDTKQMHLDLINAVALFHFIATSYRSADVDTLKAIQGAALQPRAAESLFNAIRALTIYFDSLGISFTSLEGGNMFTPRLQ